MTKNELYFNENAVIDLINHPSLLKIINLFYFAPKELAPFDGECTNQDDDSKNLINYYFHFWYFEFNCHKYKMIHIRSSNGQDLNIDIDQTSVNLKYKLDFLEDIGYRVNHTYKIRVDNGRLLLPIRKYTEEDVKRATIDYNGLQYTIKPTKEPKMITDPGALVSNIHLVDDLYNRVFDENDLAIIYNNILPYIQKIYIKKNKEKEEKIMRKRLKLYGLGGNYE